MLVRRRRSPGPGIYDHNRLFCVMMMVMMMMMKKVVSVVIVSVVSVWGNEAGPAAEVSHRSRGFRVLSAMQVLKLKVPGEASSVAAGWHVALCPAAPPDRVRDGYTSALVDYMFYIILCYCWGGGAWMFKIVRTLALGRSRLSVF